jgi:hypothetical protein
MLATRTRSQSTRIKSSNPQISVSPLFLGVSFNDTLYHYDQTPSVGNETVWHIGGIILTEENRSTRKTNFSHWHLIHHKSHID